MRTILRLGMLTALTVVVWNALNKSDSNDEDSEDSGSSSNNSGGNNEQQ